MSEFYVYPEDLSDNELPLVSTLTQTKNTIKNTVKNTVSDNTIIKK